MPAISKQLFPWERPRLLQQKKAQTARVSSSRTLEKVNRLSQSRRLPSASTSWSLGQLRRMFMKEQPWLHRSDLSRTRDLSFACVTINAFLLFSPPVLWRHKNAFRALQEFFMTVLLKMLLQDQSWFFFLFRLLNYYQWQQYNNYFLNLYSV